MQPNIPNLIELVIEKGVSNALADDHDDFTDTERLKFYTSTIMAALETGFTFLDVEEEEEDDEY